MTKRMNRPRDMVHDEAAAPDVSRWVIRDAKGAVVATGDGDHGDAEAALAEITAPDTIPIFANTLPNEKKRREVHNAEILKKYKIYT